MTMPEPGDETEECELMFRYDITRVPAFQYHYKDWRYSNLADAVAQARRDGATPS